MASAHATGRSQPPMRSIISPVVDRLAPAVVVEGERHVPELVGQPDRPTPSVVVEPRPFVAHQHARALVRAPSGTARVPIIVRSSAS